MKKILITTGLLLHFIGGMATTRSIQQARQIAESFVGSAISLYARPNLARAKVSSLTTSRESPEPYYIFNIEDSAGSSEPNGFVIVSSDDQFQDILGYCPNGKFDENDMPDGLKCWLETLEREMAAAKAADSNAKTRAYNTESNENAQAPSGQPSIPPLIKTTWAQGEPFNNSIPVGSTVYPNGKASTCCVATAMAQIMNYWQWPDYATGRHTNENHKSSFVYYGFVSYDWSKLNNHYGKYFDEDEGGKESYQEYTVEEAEEVAKLMYECGVATDTKWGNESVASNISALKALMTYYKYNKFMHAEARDVYSQREFRDILLNELNHGRPMLYWAKNMSRTGHYFICDGFDTETGMFHFNWGWSGHYDGYYALSALTPHAADGSTSNFGSFNYEQFVCVGCQPEREGNYTPVFTAQKITLGNKVEYGYAVSVTLTNMTNSSVSFNGDIGIALLQDGEIKYSKFDKTFDDLGSSEYFRAVTVPSMRLDSEIAEGTYIFCVIAQNPSGEYSIIKANYGTPYMWEMEFSPRNRSIQFTPITITDDIADAIEEKHPEPSIANTEYFTLSGAKVEYPQHGIFIRKTTYNDGTKKASKIAL